VLSITLYANRAYWTYFMNIILNTSNILEYAHIYSNILEYFIVGRAGGPRGRAGGHINNLDYGVF
jgi:hypothetical protein